MEVGRRSAMWAVLLALVVWAAPAVSVVNDKCSACKAVALELEESLANERPRNHLDYRHRLDSRGHREGKVIDYKVSELRVVELLDGLCAKMKPYVPNRAGPGREFWLKVEGGVPDVPEMALNRQQTEIHSRAIVEFCGRLLENTEEELTEKIRGGEVATGDVEQVLCRELSTSCQGTSETAPEEDEAEDEVDEAAAKEGHEGYHADDEGPQEEVAEVDVMAKADLKDSVSMGNDGEL